MAPSPRSGNRILGALANRYQRTILALLRDRTPPLSEERIATYLAVQEYEKPPANVTAEEVESFLAELYHVHLPALDEVGLITWNRRESTVKLSDDPVLADAKFNEILNMADDDLDEVLAASVHRIRRQVLRLLKERNQAISLTELAEELLTSQDEAADPASIKEATINLHHRHLAILDNAGLITYDDAEGTIRYTASPTVEKVLSVLYCSDTQPSAKLEGFFDGLRGTAEEVHKAKNKQSDLPGTWTNPNNV